MLKENELKKEVTRRRTFAIISHPDAGKTTLTEKLLLYGGAIRLAGTVKSRKSKKYAVSDWMEIEKERGISVTSSVLQFDYNDYRINILDTPGHQDFSEDTYRTLMAADSAVMLIDGAKGVEEQTKKLFEVCRMRGIPIFTFVNKLDRYCKNPFELMEEIESTLGIRSYPMNWPIGIEGDFQGVYNRKLSQIELFKDEGDGRQTIIQAKAGKIEDEEIKRYLGEHLSNQLCEDVDLLDIAGDEFDLKKIKTGKLTPLFFGSAMTNFGVKFLLEEFLNLAHSPIPRISTEGPINPESPLFSGFVFKIQANMNPAHRDRIAFIRLCSGKFYKGMEVTHVRRGKQIKLSQPQQFLAQDRIIIEEAYAGDIIGVFDPGVFNIGDTLCEGKQSFNFEGIPVFPPEYFASVNIVDVSKRKQFIKGINQISQEGAIQVFKPIYDGNGNPIIGVVGLLQFEVLEYRLKNEYGVDIKIDILSYCASRWIIGQKVKKEELGYTESTKLVEDQYQRQVVLFKEKWSLKKVIENNKDIQFMEIPPNN